MKNFGKGNAVNSERIQRARREYLRWWILCVLGKYAVKVGANETQLSYTLGAAEGLESLTREELRAALVYLHERELIHLEHGDHVPIWRARLTRVGTDLVEYTIPCEPGIARPAKDWN